MHIPGLQAECQHALKNGPHRFLLRLVVREAVQPSVQLSGGFDVKAQCQMHHVRMGRTAFCLALRWVKRYSGSSVPSLGRSASESSSQYCGIKLQMYQQIVVQFERRI